MEELDVIWKKYNEYANKMAIVLGRTTNIVGEFAEFIFNKYYNGELFEASNASADIKLKDGKLIQVKSRKHNKANGTQLSVIRSWDFNFLAVIIFDMSGQILIALEVPVEIAKEYAVKNTHQNGWVITTTNSFLNDKRSKNITKELKALLG